MAAYSDVAGRDLRPATRGRADIEVRLSKPVATPGPGRSSWQDVTVSRRLLDDGALAASSVVADCAMNRERQLAGVNSYSRELGFNPLDWLRSRMVGHDRDGTTTDVGWLDPCCGTGRALIQAADELKDDGLADRVGLIGVDLVDSFDRPAPHGGVELISASVAVWRPRTSAPTIAPGLTTRTSQRCIPTTNLADARQSHAISDQLPPPAHDARPTQVVIKVQSALVDLRCRGVLLDHERLRGDGERVRTGGRARPGRGTASRLGSPRPCRCRTRRPTGPR